jgi:predicted RecA/RadA family phage recombinase
MHEKPGMTFVVLAESLRLPRLRVSTITALIGLSVASARHIDARGIEGMFLVPAATTDMDQGEVVALVVARSKAVNADGAATEAAARQCCVLIQKDDKVVCA